MEKLIFMVFSVFVSHTRLLGGRSESAVLSWAVPVFVAFGGLLQAAYFVGYGWNVSWLGAVEILVLGLLAGGFLGTEIEKRLGSSVFSWTGFVVGPACAYLLFKQLSAL